MTIKVISEYARQFQWPDIGPVNRDNDEDVAGVPSFKEHITIEPPLKTKNKATLEIVHKKEGPDVSDVRGSPSKNLHIVREPSFIKKKRVPGLSPERYVKSEHKGLAARAGVLKQGNSARYKSEYTAHFSPKKGLTASSHESPIQSALSMVHESHTNLPIGVKPDAKIQSEYTARYPDPSSELKYLRAVLEEQKRKKEVQLEREEAEKRVDEGVPPTKKIQLKICTPMRKDKPKIRVTYDIISPHKPPQNYWKSEYTSQFEAKDRSPIRQSPAKDRSPVRSSPAKSSHGKRAHPYKQSPGIDKVADLIQPDASKPATPPPTTDTKTWYDEVLELRNLAQKFKAKSHGSHFSPKKLGSICYSSAQLRVITPPLSPVVSDESIRIIPQEKKKAVILSESVPPVPLKEATILQEPTSDAPEASSAEAPIEPSVQLGKPLINMADLILPTEAEVKQTTSLCSTPPSILAERSNTLFSERVTTPQLIANKISGSRHHLDRTTRTTKLKPRSTEPLHNTIMAGRCETPRLHEIGGYRHHLDGTTPSVMNCKSLMESLKKESVSGGTQPFEPQLMNDVNEKLDFSSPAKDPALPKPDLEPILPAPPNKKTAWTEDLDTAVLSRASSCSSIAAATLEKAKTRGKGFWK